MSAESPPTEGVAETARDQAGQLKETSADAAREVAGTVKEKVSDVTSDVRAESRRLASQTRQELVGQASQQKDRAATALRSVSDELRGMAEDGQSGLGSQLARQGAEFTDQAADFLQQHEPADLLDEVRGYARRKPGTFLLIAAAAGVVAGRLTRALAAGGASGTTRSGTPASNGSLYSNGSAGGNGVPEPAADEYLVPPPAAPMGTPVTPPRPGPGTEW
ncbi:hypothetical protein OHA18_37075 [Kribbella sp. NBC_00709]|uniref:hypothetical protein n=1 Tax=Kribbella sp. NBC_00709 TaxID=2975972 RepID=UPI002E2AEFF8|nr:hypothetical protein [Kribbella sp. NBC_00709]